MERRSSINLFPMLSIMVAAMGTLAFLAITLGIVQSRSDHVANANVRVNVVLQGAPPHARALPIECRSDGATLHAVGGMARFFSIDRLQKEAAIVRDLHDRSTNQAGGILTRDQEWLFFKAVIERDVRLNGSLTLALHLIEMSNLKGEVRNTKREEYYPVLLVYADGIQAYDLVTYLLESTSRLPGPAEPMLPGWGLQRVHAAIGAESPAAPAGPRIRP